MVEGGLGIIVGISFQQGAHRRQLGPDNSPGLGEPEQGIGRKAILRQPQGHIARLGGSELSEQLAGRGEEGRLDAGLEQGCHGRRRYIDGSEQDQRLEMDQLPFGELDAVLANENRTSA